MLDDDVWLKKVIDDGLTICPECESTDLTMGACGVSAILVQQEYICNACQFEFKVWFRLAAYFPN
jgi:transposase-like protein